jgi:hypothetical protein
LAAVGRARPSPEGAVQQRLHGRAALEHHRLRGHGGHDVGPHHGPGCRGVALFVGVDEPAQDVLLGRGQRSDRPLAAVAGQPFPQHGPGPLQGAVHRGRAGGQGVSGLGRGPAQAGAQHQRGALPGRQGLDGGDEGQLDGLPGDRGRLRAPGLVRDLI